VERVTTGAGNEAIELESGQRLRYVARSKGSGRGFTGGKLILDEAYALEAEEMAALLPTLATQAEAQLVYTSSAGMVSSTHLRSVRNRGRAGQDPSLCYLEWGGTAVCPDDCMHLVTDPTCKLNDQELWRAANPGFGVRIPAEFIAKERRALGGEEFARERLGVWDEPVGVGAVPLESWAQCADDESAPSGRPVFAIDVAPGSRSAAIVAAMYRPDGLPHLEVVAHAPTTDWVVGQALELMRHRPLDWVLDPAGPAGALLPELAAVGIEPRQLSTRDLGQACEAFGATVAAQALRHLGDPVLARAIAAAGRRDIGDGLWAWSRRKSTADICPLVAATVAHWGLSVVPPAPPPAPPPVVTTSVLSETNGLATAGF
jgi:phage terminase large subunit-like protein